MKIKFFVIAVVLLMSGSLSARAQPRACSCADKVALLNLYNEAEMNITELEFQFKSIEEQEPEMGKTVMATEEQITKMYESISNALKLFPTSNYSEESMDPVDCSLKTTNIPSDCVTLILKHTYEPIQKKCKERRSPNKPFYEGMDMKSYVWEIMTANYAMRDYILQMLKSLPKTCRPNGWFGYVAYQKIVTDESVRNTPPKGDSRSGVGPSTIIQSQKDTYIGTVFVEGGKAVNVKAYASQSINNTSNGSSRCPVVGGVIERASALSDKFSGEQEVAFIGYFDLDVNLAKGLYYLKFGFLPVKITGQRNLLSKGFHGGCNNKMIETNNTQTLTVEVKAGDIIIVRKIKPGSSPDFLEGSEVDKPAEYNESVKMAGVTYTKTFEIQTRWMLRRLPTR
jgi:hypothetical protein